MTEQAFEQKPDLIAMAGEIAASYVIGNHIAVSELPGLILSLHAALTGLAPRMTAPEPEPDDVSKPTAAQIRKSITSDALYSFIDGKAYKTLKRHLARHGLDPRGYRQKYGLAHDYPMVAPAYSERRSALSKGNDFGRAARGQSKEAG